MADFIVAPAGWLMRPSWCIESGAAWARGGERLAGSTVVSAVDAYRDLRIDRRDARSALVSRIWRSCGPEPVSLSWKGIPRGN